MKLEPSYEFVGTLTELHTLEGKTILYFSIQKKIEMPLGSIHKDILKSAVGKRIGVINIDGNYKIREIRKKA
jgi:hypothetical protein